MRVTVAICTWNRAQLLDQTLTAMCLLRIPDGVEWELLIVNNNCTDSTEDVISRHSNNLPIRRFFEPEPGLSNARNRALSEAEGDLILWTDDDVLVAQDWFAALVDAARHHPDAAGFGGPIDPWFPSPPDPCLIDAFPALKLGFCGLDHAMEEGPLPSGKPIWGANMAFRTTAVKGIRFNPALGTSPKNIKTKSKNQSISIGAGEEEEYVELVRECGGSILWVPRMRLQHYVDPARMTLAYLTLFYLEIGKKDVRRNGVPLGPQVFGFPRWVLRKWLEAFLRHGFHRLTRSRVASLTWLRRRCHLSGMLQECRTIQRAGR